MTGEFAATLGAGLLHSLWLGPLVAGLAALCGHAVSPGQPRVRLRIAAVALVTCATSPLWLPLVATLPRSPWMAGVSAAWGVGVGLALLRLWNSRRAVRTLRQQARPAMAAWQARLDACALELGHTRPVALLTSNDRETPCTLGARRPAVVLPADHLAWLDEPAWRAVMMHELAHVAHRDYAWHLLHAVVAAFGVHQPAMPWLMRIIGREREAACDAVVANHIAPDELAAALVTIERRRSRGTARAPQAAGLLTRVERLVHGSSAPAWSHLAARAGLVGVAVALVAYATVSMTVAATAVPWAAAAGLGLIIGLRHALEPDHMVAVAMLVTRERSIREAVRLGTSWGAGHTVALLGVGLVLTMARRAMPDSLATAFELAVGLMLVVLGARAVRQAWRDGQRGPVRVHDHGGLAHAHATAGAHLHIGGVTLSTRPLVVGLVHGLAGSGALTALAVASLPAWPQQLAFMLVFAMGSTLGMAAVTGLAGWPLARGVQSPRAMPALSGAMGMLAVAVGVSWSLPLLARQLGY